MRQKMFALVDCNNFFVSCERVFRPDLLNRPVVVLSSNDGCIVSRSNEVKALGIPMGAPYFQFRDWLLKDKVAVFSSNFELYRDISARVMQTVSNFTDEIEVYSVDEAFLKIPYDQHLVEYGENIRQTVLRWTKIPVSVGIAPTKVLAKLASFIAKHNSEFQGVCFLDKNIDSTLAQVPVQEVWGIGRKHADVLRERRIFTALDLKNSDDSWVRKNLTIHGLQIVHELRGISCFSLHSTHSPQKTLMYSRSFGTTISTLENLERVFTDYTSRAAENLREEHLIAGQMLIYIRTRRFSSGPRFHASKAVTLPIASSFTPQLVKVALEGLRSIFRPGFQYAKAGIIFSDLRSESTVQQNFFEKHDFSKEKNLMQALDTLNQRFGRDTVRLASLATQQPWRVKNDHRSLRFTTNLSELPLVR